MRVPIRPGPVLGAGGLFGVMAVVVGQCTPPSISTGAPTTGPGYLEPVPISAPATTPPLAPDAPVTVAPTTAPTTQPPPPTAATAPPTQPTAPATVAPTTVPPAPAPTAPPAAPTPPPTIVESAPPPPPPPPPPPAEPPAPPPPPPPPPPVPQPPAQAVSALVALVNDQRAAAGLPPLTEVGSLTEAARSHSIDQASRQQMTHTGSDGSSAGDRMARAGFAASTWAENVAAGYTSAASVMDGWMGSTGHRENILSPAFTSIGVASAQAGDGTTYWTMDLAA